MANSPSRSPVVRLLDRLGGNRRAIANARQAVRSDSLAAQQRRAVITAFEKQAHPDPAGDMSPQPGVGPAL